ncbi:hypothetical protein PHLGIDRAFT_122448 [Phlebiopsis gigantea 11061_1 CR5-6]|uniref:Transmembrane protein n=1 Tax=Phlebiopsis gigantea (strain 11061_1 CR5-6) TaxID=745531 RepID=A0A0C3S3K4_PHLG1|nr:hypothetical protein PHLGIDRAFT_122448 [Phlebiopsis gigantea 11061_1 CR5-6]
MFYHTVGAARLVNVTVDDQDLRIQYAPEEKHWMSLVGQDCDNGCNTSPDPAQVFNHTWHDATYNFKGSGMSAPQTFAFQFNGSALFVYGIQLSSFEMDLLFFMDSKPAGNYTFPGDSSSTTYTYDTSFYANPSLQPGEHFFLLQNGQGDGGEVSHILFDYLVYTVEVDDDAHGGVNTSMPGLSSTSTATISSPHTLTISQTPKATLTSPPGAAASGDLVKVLPVAISVTVLLAVITLFLWLLRRKHATAETVPNTHPRTRISMLPLEASQPLSVGSISPEVPHRAFTQFTEFGEPVYQYLTVS